MKNFLKLSLIALFSTLLVNCTTRVGGVNLAGYVYDSKTGAKMTDYTMEIETANTTMSSALNEIVIASTATGAADAEVGKFTVNIPVNEQFIVRVTAAGYNSFTSSTIAGLTEVNTNTANQPKSDLVNILMTPEGTFATAGIVNVVDFAGGAAIKGAKLVNTGVAVSANNVTRGFQATGTNVGEDTKAFWVADIAGTDAGVISIPVDTLKKGYQYDFKVEADGYSFSALIAIDTDSLSANEVFDGTGKTISLNKHAANGALALVAASNEVYVNGIAKPISGILSVTYTFNQAVKIDTTGLYGAGITAAALFGGTFFTSDATASGGDFDGTTTGLDLSAEVAPVSATTTTAATKSNLIDVTSSGSSITVTISPSFTTKDTGDIIRFDVTNITGLVKVRAASDVNITSGSSVLNTLTTAQQERLYYQAGTLTGF